MIKKRKNECVTSSACVFRVHNFELISMQLVWEFRGEMRVTKEKQILRVFEWPWNENLEGNRPIQVRSPIRLWLYNYYFIELF